LDEKVNYEPETTRIFDAVLKEGDSVIIAGAHQGYFVSYMANLVGKSGRVFAFEPEPKNFGILSETVKGLDNVEIFNFAIGDKKAKANFYVNSDNDGGHALWDVSTHPSNEKTRANPQVLSIEVNTVDELYPDGIPNLKLMMLDAEGAEPAIIKGAINTIVDSECPYIIAEINNGALKQCNTSQGTLRSYLSMYGFKGYMMNVDEVIEVGDNSVKAVVKDTDQEVVFNMLFSRRGKV
jgi:FkbM family methyltransferase